MNGLFASSLTEEMNGRVLKLLMPRIRWGTKLIAIHKQANHRIVHEDRFRETNSFSCQPLEPRTQRQLFAFNLLRRDFADGMGGSRKVAVRDSCRIGIKVH